MFKVGIIRISSGTMSLKFFANKFDVGIVFVFKVGINRISSGTVSLKNFK